MNPRRITRSAIIIKPSTLFRFHNALKKRKYRLLFSPRAGHKPGPKEPSQKVIPDKAGQALNAIVEMKRRNPRFGYPRLAQQINLAFDLDLDKDTIRRVLATHYRPHPNNHGPSWLTTIGRGKDSLWSVDLFHCESILLKSHWAMVVIDQYTRRFIGSIRRELLDHTLFWTATDLDNKLQDYQRYYNNSRSHSGQNGCTPIEASDNKVIDINKYKREKHCRGLFELPIAA